MKANFSFLILISLIFYLRAYSMSKIKKNNSTPSIPLSPLLGIQKQPSPTPSGGSSSSTPPPPPPPKPKVIYRYEEDYDSKCSHLIGKLPMSQYSLYNEVNKKTELYWNKDGTLSYKVYEYKTKSYLQVYHEYRIGNPQQIDNSPYTLDVNEMGKLIIKDKNDKITWEYEKTIKGKKPYKISVGAGRLIIKDSNDQIFFDERDYFNKKYNDVPLDIKAKLIGRFKSSMNSYPESQANVEFPNEFNIKVQETKFVFSDTETLKFIPYNDANILLELQKHFIDKEENVRFIEKKEYKNEEWNCETNNKNEKVCKTYNLLNKHLIISSYYEKGKLYYYGIYAEFKSNIKKEKYNEEIKKYVLFKTYLAINKIYLETQERVNKKIKLQKLNKVKDKKLKIYENLKEMLERIRKENEENNIRELKNLCGLGEIDLLSRQDQQRPPAPAPVLPLPSPSPIPSLPILPRPYRGSRNFFEKYIINTMERDITIYYDTFDVNSVEEISRKYNFPQVIKDKIEVMSYSSQTTDKQELRFTIDHNLGSYESILGIAVREGKNMFLIFANNKVEATLTPNKEVRPDFTKCFGIHGGPAANNGFCLSPDPQKYYADFEQEEVDGKLYTHCRACPYIEIDQGYTKEDKNEMREIFENYGIEEILTKLELMDSTQTLLTKNINIISNNKRYVAKIGDDGKIYVGSNYRLSNLFKNPLYTSGLPQPLKFKPYELLISEEGQLYIINNDKERVWKAKMINNSGVSPFTLKLSDSGDLLVIDSNGQTVSNLRVNNK